MPPTDYALHDPLITEEGVEQCGKLRESLKERLQGIPESDIAIVVSPMRRTIQTALYSLDFLIEKKVPLTADAAWQETTAKPCDTGSPIAELTKEYPMIDFSSVDPVFPDKHTPAGAKYFPFKTPLLARGRACVRSLYRRPEKYVIVVSHSGFLRTSVSGWWFFNGDYRIFDFADGNGADVEDDWAGGPVPKLVQWESTLSGGLGWSWTDPVPLGEGLREEGEQPQPKA